MGWLHIHRPSDIQIQQSILPTFAQESVDQPIHLLGLFVLHPMGRLFNKDQVSVITEVNTWLSQFASQKLVSPPQISKVGTVMRELSGGAEGFCTMARYQLSMDRYALLWDQMQNEHGAVWRELSDLADAHAAGDDITITVHADTVHADLIRYAIEWVIANTEPVPLPKRECGNSDIPFDYTGIDLPEDRWPVYDPEDNDMTQTAFDPGRVRWIVGHRDVLLGYLYDTDAVRTALVVDHGLAKLGRQPASIRPFTGKLDPHWVAAVSAMLHELEPDAVPLRLDIHSGDTTHDDIRYAPWRPDSLVPDETNVTPFNHSQVIGRSLPEVVWRSRKRPYFLRRAPGEHVRPVLRWHHSQTRPPRVLGAKQQTHGHFYAWRKATSADCHQLHVT